MNEATSAQRTGDPITDVLRGTGSRDSQKLISTAQKALVKLGYSIEVTGAQGAETTAALRDFEKSHGLPVSIEVTARLVKLLNAAMISSTSR